MSNEIVELIDLNVVEKKNLIDNKITILDYTFTTLEIGRYNLP